MYYKMLVRGKPRSFLPLWTTTCWWTSRPFGLYCVLVLAKIPFLSLTPFWHVSTRVGGHISSMRTSFRHSVMALACLSNSALDTSSRTCAREMSCGNTCCLTWHSTAAYASLLKQLKTYSWQTRLARQTQLGQNLQL